MSFIHLHVYSAFSLLKSTASIAELVYSAKEKGYKALALTDHNIMHGAVAFYKECKKAGIKPLLGLVADVESEQDPSKFYPLILLAKDKNGFGNLLKISSVLQTKAENGIPAKWLKHYSRGLIAITPGTGGEIEHFLMNEEEETAEKVLKGYRSMFAENNFYMALQHQLENDQQHINKTYIDFAEKFNIPLAATNPVYYLKQEDAFSHGCLLAIKNGEKLQDEDREKLKSDQYYLKSPKEMIDALADYPDALENTLLINERCNVELDLHKQHLPKFPLQEGGSAEELLEKLCFEGLLKRVPSYTETYKERIRYELSVITKMKFSDYFLIVWDFMKYARENGILTGPGRGSAAGSLVAYVLYITDVDPIEYELLFERFLNPERISMPDIDIDFPDHRRDEVIEYVAAKYGDIHVAQIATFGTFAAKASLRDVGRVFGLNPKELDMLSRMVPSKLGITLEDAYKESAALQAFVKEDNLKRRLFETARKFEGLPRHISTHAAGIVISENPLVDLVPIQRGHNDVYLTQYAMDHLEDVGLLKMDFLGLRNLSLIESIVASVQKHKGIKIDVRKIPLDDSETYHMLSRGETTGIFQLESDGMRKVLMRLKPTCFEDIVAVNALYRPGPMENIPSFINRKHGNEAVGYPHEELKPILENTYGIIVYQEQIMQIASKMAGFSLGQADLLRRAIGKKKKEVLDEERKRFVNGAVSKGYNLGLANEVYDLIVKFADYGFNRSHAVAYSMISCQLAYLKKHYFPYFMAELMTSVSGNEIKLAQYIREAKQNGLSILPPSINKSSHRFHVEKNDIRFSLASIKGVGATALKEIFSSRKSKKFEDLFDFCLRVSPKIINRKILETLVHSGSFDEFGEDRAVLLASIDVALDHAQLVKPDDSGQFDLFEEEAFSLKPKYTEVDPIRIEDKLDFEKQALGLYLSNHPVSVFEHELKSKGTYSLFEIPKNSKEAAVGVYITGVRKIRTKKGEAMAFLAVSDSSGEMDAVVFPLVFKKYAQLLNQGSLVIIEGKLEEREGKEQFVVQGAYEPSEWFEHKQSKESTLYVKITVDRDSPELLQQVKSLLTEHNGHSSVVVFSENTKKSVRLSDDHRVNPNSSLLIKLKKLLGESNVILQKNNSLQ